MVMRSLTPMLQTSNMDRTIDGYGDVLGFRCVSRMDDGWCHLESDGVSLMFMRCDHLGAPHATATQYIYVDDVHALWKTLKDRVTAEWGPEDMSYGMREFAIRDPDGYLLSFGQPLHPVDGEGKALPS
jgi:catechol 2,3-dioxygenase-like lactoylglutathione lyase family enzyme